MMAFEEIVGLRKGVCYQIGLFLYRKKSKITEFWNCAILFTIFTLIGSLLIYIVYFYLAYEISYNKLFKSKEKLHIKDPVSIYILIFAFILFIISSIFIVRPYILSGSYSIEEFQRNNDIATFVVKETGITYGATYIDLKKMNVEGSTFKYIDSITINSTQEATSNLMRGQMSEGAWYVNVNTSNLSSGNYRIHAEVTVDASKVSIFGTVKKHDEKLFYIAPIIANYSFNSTQ